MKCKIPEISWHNRDPVLSIDIHPKIEKNGNGLSVYRLATGGSDSHVLIWYITPSEDSLIEFAADLTRHQRAVNAVKWSPSGELLASGDDESVVFIWKRKDDNEVVNICDDSNETDKEVWITLKVLRGHMEDVYDLSWAPSSNFLISGSVDNSAIIWDVHKGKALSILSDHKGFVQGVAWDPRNKYVGTLSTDRNLRIFDIQTKKTVARTNKSTLLVPEDHELFDKKVRLFHDDTLQTFFRRLCFSVDGNLIFTPSGVTDYDGCKKVTNTTYVFSRHNFKQPCLVLPSPDTYTVAIKCCPMLFKLRKNEKCSPVISLPYRMIFAIATRSSVYLYDTQQKAPIGMISNIHYTRLTDLTWSKDAKILVVSSTDGFCSIITFDDNELGETYEDQEVVFERNAKEDTISTTTKKKVKNNKRKRSPDVKAAPAAKKKILDEKVPENLQNNNVVDPDSSKVAIPSSVVSDIIIDKDIISSEEKFESPEKKGKPVTPISVRRHPRVVETTTDNSKKANPIAIRRQPRSLMETPALSEPNVAQDEAVDAWPLGSPNPNGKSDTNVVPSKNDNDVDTQNIRLVYEDTQDENVKSEAEQHNPPETNPKTPRTPRRVEFRTISTPKSKKKLID